MDVTDARSGKALGKALRVSSLLLLQSNEKGPRFLSRAWPVPLVMMLELPMLIHLALRLLLLPVLRQPFLPRETWALLPWIEWMQELRFPSPVRPQERPAMTVLLEGYHPV